MKRLAILSLSCLLSIASADSAADVRTMPSAASAVTAEPPLACGDYLKEIGHARPDVTFIGCKSVVSDEPKVPGFEATYRVQGKDIEKVDAWLATWAEWENLRFSCCQWDAPRGYYKDKRGSHFEVNMFAEAYIDGHMVNQKKDFAKIPYATLTVSHYLDIP
ncbi:DUF4952 domain-containing protein [Caballeronia arvi]|nr:DUF4952 domain-containing protein [Caballeronia arvi]